jgi:glyoxylase-like metal-dependent hydrolase (beta-lactamase superfamily II)
MLLGDYRIEIISDTVFRLDGGAMFGVVPRVVWEKASPPDAFNRIRLGTNCLFIETEAEKILIETGMGEKWTEKQIQMYGIHRTNSFAETLFEKTGCAPEDISIVVNTHLHFDHAGGNTILNAENKAVPQFSNARYFVSASEYKHAERPSTRDRASYLPDDWRPLLETGQLELKPNEYEIVEGLRMEQTRGHNAAMQTISLRRGKTSLYGFADLIPTRHHLSPAWIMSYDLFPTETLEAKNRLLPQAIKENWLCLFYHDDRMPLCRLTQKEGKILPEEISLNQSVKF